MVFAEPLFTKIQFFTIWLTFPLPTVRYSKKYVVFKFILGSIHNGHKCIVSFN